MIEEKTDGTRGSPDSELNLLGSEDNDEEEEDEKRDAFPISADDTTFGVTPLTRNAVSELLRLSGHGDKQFFEPIVQVVQLKK